MLGVHYTTAELNIRELFNFTPDDLHEAIRALTQHPEQTGITSLAILTTCNRVELYALCENSYHAEASIKQYLIDKKNIPVAILHSDAMVVKKEADVAEHLYTVAAGLDSLILGEGQILSQVKLALTHAEAAHPMHKALRVLFKEAIHVGKKVRHETGLGDRDTSVSTAAFALAKQYHPDLLEKNIAIVGGGKMACLILEALNDQLSGNARQNVRILNRSQDRLDELIERFGFTGVTWQDVDSLLDWADVAFVATGAPHLLFFDHQFETRKQPLSLFDISVPRNVCPQVSESHKDIRVFDVDDLRGIASYEPEKAGLLKQQAEAIVHKTLQHLPRCLNRVACDQEIRDFRGFVEGLHAQYLDETPIELEGLSPQGQVTAVHAWSQKFVQRLLHSPSYVVNQGHFDASQLLLLRQLFQEYPYTRHAIENASPRKGATDYASVPSLDDHLSKQVAEVLKNQSRHAVPNDG